MVFCWGNHVEICCVLFLHVVSVGLGGNTFFFKVSGCIRIIVLVFLLSRRNLAWLLQGFARRSILDESLKLLEDS
jgi:hypothetical protein